MASHDYLLLNYGDGYAMFDGSLVFHEFGKLDIQVLINYIANTLAGVMGAEYAVLTDRVMAGIAKQRSYSFMPLITFLERQRSTVSQHNERKRTAEQVNQT